MQSLIIKNRPIRMIQLKIKQHQIVHILFPFKLQGFRRGGRVHWDEQKTKQKKKKE